VDAGTSPDVVNAGDSVAGRAAKDASGRPSTRFVRGFFTTRRDLMAIDLSKPPAWLASSHEEQQMLRDLQGNILKGHGRPETTNIFFKLAPTRAQASRRALRKIVKEAKDAGIARWDPQFGLGAALVAEPPATPDAVIFGSDFILRKLEQDVRGFKRREQLLSTELLLTGEEKREIPRDNGPIGAAHRWHIMPRRGIPFGGHRAAGASVGFARQRERRRIGHGPRAAMPRVARSSYAQLMRQA